VFAAVAPLTAGVNLTELAAAQSSCPSVAEMMTSSKLRVTSVPTDDQQLFCDSSTGILRPLVPSSHRRAVFDAVHSVSHPGVRGTRRLISSRWVWPRLAADVAAWCRDCQSCCRAKVTTQPSSPPIPIPIPTQRFTHIHVDIVGPLPPSSCGKTHLLTIIDRTTRWLEAVPLSSTTAAACADALVGNWICRYGVPSDLTSDRGPQFSSELWAALMTKLGIQHHSTTAFHPQSNGMVERVHRRLKEGLKARPTNGDWLSHLPWVLLGIRSTPRSDSGVSPAELAFGSPLTLPSQLLPAVDANPEAVESSFPVAHRTEPLRPLSYAEVAGRIPGNLATAEFVYIRRGGSSTPLTPPYSGPFRVLRRSNKTFTVDVGGRHDLISMDRLKPHLGAAPLQPAAPPRRGRPPTSSTSVQASTVA